MYLEEFKEKECTKIPLEVSKIGKVESLMKSTKDELEIRNEMLIKDLKKLRIKKGPGNSSEFWLNDLLIDNYFQLITKSYKDVKAFGCFVFKTLEEKREEETLKRIRSLRKMFDFRTVLFPIIKDNHWTLVSFNVRKKTLISLQFVI